MDLLFQKDGFAFPKSVDLLSKKFGFTCHITLELRFTFPLGLLFQRFGFTFPIKFRFTRNPDFIVGRSKNSENRELLVQVNRNFGLRGEINPRLDPPDGRK